MAEAQTLAARVKELRELAELSQKQVGDRCGLTAGAIGMIESGERETPTGETLLKIARGYGTTVEYLLTGEGRKPTKRTVRAALSKEGADSAPTFPAGVRTTRTSGAN